MTIDLDFIKRLRMESLPGYALRVERRDRVVAELGRRRATQTTANPQGRIANPEQFELEAMLDAGDPLEELDQRIAARLTAETAGGRALAALMNMRQRLADDVAAAERDTFKVLPMLHTALTERVQEAQGLGALDEIATPDAVKTSKRYADHDRLDELLDELETIRFEQFTCLRASGHEFGYKSEIFHVIRDVPAIFPNRAWLPWLTPGWLGKKGTNGQERAEVQTPWPRPVSSQVMTRGFALWALEAGADQWVATIAQAERAEKGLKAESLKPRYDDDRFGEWYDPGPSERYERPTDITGGSLRR